VATILVCICCTPNQIVFRHYSVPFCALLFCHPCCHPTGLGGPTGYAANPARDLGPRLAHFLLPIPGKGSSEWSYAWIPGFAPLVGGVIAGVLYIAIEVMQFPEGGSRGGGGNYVG
jgi:glycerol uptake facilitator-like aquaporin